MLIDTHAHLWFPDYYPLEADQPGYYDELEQVLERAKEVGVEKMIVPGTDMESSKQAVELARKYPGVIYAAVGVHPEELVGRNLQNSNEETPPPADGGVPTRPLAGSPVEESPLGLRELITENRKQVVAIGEIGTDGNTEELKKCMGEQKELFRVQCELALEGDLPVIIHTRNSLAEALEVLDALPSMPRGQFHCFSHDENGVKEVLERGFHVSFCANITWSKRVARLVPLVPLDRLLLETDSPLMKPGGRNEPANVTITGQIIADLRGESLKAVGEQTTVNALRLFRL